jgi:ABC-type amino acid transport substrate-binding protein
MHDLRKGDIDLTILPLTATSERLAKLRLSIPFYISNMGIASRIEKQSPLLQLIKNIFSWKIIRSGIIILLIATVFAVFLWLAERKKNSKQFRPGIMGVTDGVWWAFVTMTTVGYGDMIPKTIIGRALAIFWMFFAIGMFFIASGVISSELTVTKLQSQIKDPNDLKACKVGVVYRTGYAETLSRHNIHYTTFKSIPDGLKAVNAGLIDAFVYDQAILQYVVDKFNLKDKIVIIPSGLNLQYFSYMTSKNNLELMDKINLAMLKVIDSDSWDDILLRYGIEH